MRLKCLALATAVLAAAVTPEAIANPSLAGLAAENPGWYKCSLNDECVITKGLCDIPKGINKKFLDAHTAWMKTIKAKCQAGYQPPQATLALCVDSVCRTDADGGLAHAPHLCYTAEGKSNPSQVPDDKVTESQRACKTSADCIAIEDTCKWCWIALAASQAKPLQEKIILKRAAASCLQGQTKKPAHLCVNGLCNVKSYSR